MKKLLIVDGMNLLFQMFFGMPAKIVGKSGRAVQGTLGFVGALLRIIRMTEPGYIVVLFDGECHNERRDIDPDYKANREDFSDKPEDEIPFSQLPDIYAALDFMGIPYFETSDCEADDLAAAYAALGDDELSVVISSFDSDLFQLINDRVSLLRYKGDSTVICDREYVEKRYGVPPEKYADFKALVGDSSDNIRGAEKIGPKTAASLISEFSSLEGVLAAAESVKKPSVRASLLESADRLRRNLKIIKLTPDHPLPIPLDSLIFTKNEHTTREVLEKIGVF